MTLSEGSRPRSVADPLEASEAVAPDLQAGEWLFLWNRGPLEIAIPRAYALSKPLIQEPGTLASTPVTQTHHLKYKRTLLELSLRKASTCT